MLRGARMEWRRGGRVVVSALAVVVGLALPALGQEEPEDEGAASLEVGVVPDPNDPVLILSDGIPPLEIRVRRPQVRTHQSLHTIDRLPDPDGIPTRGMSSRPVDTVYHGTLDYAEPTLLRTRRAAGQRVFHPIRTHAIGLPAGDARIRYHGGFR